MGRSPAWLPARRPRALDRRRPLSAGPRGFSADDGGAPQPGERARAHSADHGWLLLALALPAPRWLLGRRCCYRLLAKAVELQGRQGTERYPAIDFLGV